MAEQVLFAASVGFEGARQLTQLPEGNSARGLHGHSFLAEVRSAVPEGWAQFPGGEVGQLRDRLAAAVAPLDYEHLNRRLDQPTDENLARWIRGRLALESPDKVGVQSTLHKGVDLDRNDHAHIWRRYAFEAAHQLPNVPPGHKCGRMHGHGFEVVLHADQGLGPRALGIGDDRLDEFWAPLYSELKFACLNELSGLENPTSEMISAWIWGRLKLKLPELSWVTVHETRSCGACFDGLHYRIWTEMSFDSALRLKRAPETDVRRRIHGHTYTLRLHLHGPLDQVTGWIMDFGDVKELFNPIVRRLDHWPLHEVMGAQDVDTASLARWVRVQAQDLLPQLDRIDLYETRGCGVILSWGEFGPALPV